MKGRIGLLDHSSFSLIVDIFDILLKKECVQIVSETYPDLCEEVQALSCPPHIIRNNRPFSVL